MKTGERFEDSELSTVDTALLLAGVLFCQSYFDRRRSRGSRDPQARRRDLSPRRLALGAAERAGDQPRLVARGRLHRVRLARLQRGDADVPARARLADAPGGRRTRGPSGRAPTTSSWGTSSARSTSTSRRCSATSTRTCGSTSAASRTPTCAARPRLFREQPARDLRAARLRDRQSARCKDYGANVWGLTASDGPADLELENASGKRAFSQLLRARRRSSPARIDDGTLAPTAAAASMPFAPEIVDSRRARRCTRASASTSTPTYGFLDAFNPTFDFDVPLRQRPLHPGLRLGRPATTSASTRARSSR